MVQLYILNLTTAVVQLYVLGQVQQQQQRDARKCQYLGTHVAATELVLLNLVASRFIF